MRVVARRGPTTIARTRHGLVMAAAGIDASNVTAGRLVLLPLDPDASARRLRRALARATRRQRRRRGDRHRRSRLARRARPTSRSAPPGSAVVDDHAGRVDGYGNVLAVTLPAVADEIAGAAELATGKLSMSPLSVVRGLGRLVLPRRRGRSRRGRAGAPRARGHVRPGRPRGRAGGPGGGDRPPRPGRAGHPGLGAPVAAGELVAALAPPWRRPGAAPAPRAACRRRTRTGSRSTWPASTSGPAGRAEVVLGAVAAAHGWRVDALHATRAALVPALSVD